MDWQQFLQVIAIPAWAFNMGAIVWAYVDLRASIRFNEKRIETELTALRLQQQALQLEIVKGYVPKDDVLRLENRILDAFAKLEEKIERIYGGAR